MLCQNRLFITAFSSLINHNLVVGIFKANNPVNTFLLFIYGLLLKFTFFSHLPLPSASKTDGVLYRDFLLLLQTISNDAPFVYSFITYLLIFTQAVTFNKIITDQRLLQRTSYLPAMSYLLITSMFAEWNSFSSMLIVNTLLVWVWYKINTLSNTASPKRSLYNIGIALGIATLFYFPSLAFSLLLVFALLFFRPFKPAEWLLALIGVITPFYFLFAWMFLSDTLAYYRLAVFDIAYPVIKNYWLYGSIILIGIAFITGTFYVQLNTRKQVVQIRKSWSLMVVYLLIALIIPFVNDAHTFKSWIVAALPLSAFAACAFLYPTKKWFTFLLHWLMVVCVIVISYYYK